nr:immunoglobulin light chain junction region [Macaca mulatta]
DYYCQMYDGSAVLF